MKLFAILFSWAVNLFVSFTIRFLYNSPGVLLKGIQARFLRGLASGIKSVLAPFFEVTVSDSDKETYILFDHFGVIKEWLDEIDYSFLKDFEFSIKNKDWETGFLINRNTLEDSKTTLGNDVEREIKFSLNKWGVFADKLIGTIIAAGETGLAFDGVAFFAKSRPALQKAGTTIDNLLAQTAATLAGVLTDIPLAMTALRGFKSKADEPYNYDPKFLCMIPPALEWIFKTIRDSVDIISGGVSVTNIYKGTFDYVVSDYLSGSNSWYMVNSNTPFKPFIYQTRKNPEFDMKDEKDKKFIKYFSTARMNAGYGNPLAIVKIKA